ncbi:aldehyde dehydrogenase family protein [Nocardioides litoris]|uniref:aldehyde dehydrogenase family protein n=1 Tax=Nocardioides litoris TaxID=1926648 RepID=UPI0014769466|nr:aldehyde dehydrogenase family protein [Nocardioides litoris]
MTEHDCTVRELVDGTLATPAETLKPRLCDSDTGGDLHAQAATSADALEAAVAAASRVHTEESWTGLPLADRAAAVRRLAAELSVRADRLAAADSLDTGVPLTWTTALVGGRVGLLEQAAADLEAGWERTELTSAVGPADQWRLPWGPAAVLLPWNAPAPTVVTKTVDALLAGCPVVVKASEWAPHFSGPFAEAVQAAGLAAGLVQVVHGGREVGEALVTDPRVRAVSYTGGVAGGTEVARACAAQLKPADLELSGNNPVLALPDADPAEVAAEVAFGLQLLNGQVCVGPRRLVVPADRLDDHLAALDAALADVMLGRTDDPATTTGPLAHPGHRAHLERQVAAYAALGCDVRRYGTLPDGEGLFLQPTVVLADRGASLRDEVFGPVLLVRTYGDLDEAVASANDHAYGLVGYVFGADRDQARAVGRRLRAGLVTVNAVLRSGSDAPAVGSMWGASGLGTVGDGQGPAFFAGHRFVG